MNGSFFKLGRFIFLRWLLGIALVICLIYLEEDWRGARAWAATKAEWEAKGESFDRAKFTPPPVPDEQNLTSIPLFKIEPETVAKGEPFPSLVTLKKALHEDSSAVAIPELGKWSTGELPDMTKIRATIASDYAVLFNMATPPESALAQFDAIYPSLAELRAASASRPFFRFDLDYSADPPYRRYLGPVTFAIALSKLLTLHAILALHEHQADLAIEDLRLNQQILMGTQRDPSLVGGLVAIGMRAISNAVIYDGLTEHLWNDTQLAEIDVVLKPVDFLAAYQFAMRTEVLYALATIEYVRQPSHRSDLDKLRSPEDHGTLTFADVFARGWWDDNERQFTDFYFNEVSAVDPQARLVFPDIANRLKLQSERKREKWNALAPWNFFFVLLSPGMSLVVEKYAEGQVSVDETRIACALERYHLAHGVYPESLGALAPSYLDEVPHDIMNGQPYHYQLRGDGTFLLYSVGWNKKDDGGVVKFEKESPKIIDYENGDWVWPAPKVAD